MTCGFVEVAAGLAVIAAMPTEETAGFGDHGVDCKASPEIKTWRWFGLHGCDTIHSVGYRFLIVNSGVPNMRVGIITESRDGTFSENEFPMKNAPSTSSQEPILSPEHFAPIEHIDQTPEENLQEDDIVATRKSKRQRIAKSFEDDCIVYLVNDTPRTIEEAYSSPDADY
uniref:Retrotransposon protein, putative, Ty1-copia subclass n=2 Tax=Oryza sativa subsp. japonica TaxID=39947 RepID=Q8S638_ORYSJ|nr:hypothetical protein [Oryza sativa Japonica Group]AAP52704.1 retrotransposon protein, putative, Ty1-copia subclass [Oryza sativa Japonica Group]